MSALHRSGRSGIRGRLAFSTSCANQLLLAALCLGAFPQCRAQQTISAKAPPASITQAPQSLENQADLLMARGSYAAALDLYQQVQPRSAVIWNKIGVAYHHLFAVDQAVLSYKQAIALDPHYAEAYNNLGAALYGRQQYAPAEKAYKRALKYRPHSPSTYSNLGTLYFAESKYKRGIQAYQRALALDPEVFSRDKRHPIEQPASRQQRIATDFYLAEVYAGAGKNDQAIASLRKALSEGFTDRKRLLADKEFASLRDTPAFQQMLVDEHLESSH